MDQYRRLFSNPPKGGTERSGVPTTSLLNNPPPSLQHVAAHFLNGVETAQTSRVSMAGPTQAGGPSEGDLRNFDRGRPGPRTAVHARPGDVAYEAQRARDYYAQSVAAQDTQAPPLGIDVPRLTANPPPSLYRADGKDQPGAVEAAPELGDLEPRAVFKGAALQGQALAGGRT